MTRLETAEKVWWKEGIGDLPRIVTEPLGPQRPAQDGAADGAVFTVHGPEIRAAIHRPDLAEIVPEAVQQVLVAADAEMRAQAPVHLGHRQVLDR